MTAPLVAAALATTQNRRLNWESLSKFTPASDDTNTPLAGGRVDPDPAAIPAAAEAIRGFSSDFYRAMALNEDGASLEDTKRGSNVVCSPFSVAIALAMTRAGARGTTAGEMDAVLRAPAPTPTRLDAGLNALDQLMITSYRDPGGDGTKRPNLAIANSLWPRLGMTLEAPFLATLARYYGAEPHPVDFATATEAARREINAWVSDHTAGLIPELLARGIITPQTALVLANALSLRASWRIPFLPTSTVNAPFKRDDGTTVTAPMMTAPVQEIGYQAGDGWVAADLPYVGDQLAMAVVVPTRGDLPALTAKLDGALMKALLTGFRPDWVEPRLPRWAFRVPANLNELLATLGMPTAFTTRADFSGMAREPGLRITDVVHETFISVDEKGTEAAAATAVIIGKGAPPKWRPVVADRPFLFIIHDVPRAIPLFVGGVADPTA